MYKTATISDMMLNIHKCHPRNNRDMSHLSHVSNTLTHGISRGDICSASSHPSHQSPELLTAFAPSSTHTNDSSFTADAKDLHCTKMQNNNSCSRYLHNDTFEISCKKSKNACSKSKHTELARFTSTEYFERSSAPELHQKTSYEHQATDKRSHAESRASHPPPGCHSDLASFDGENREAAAFHTTLSSHTPLQPASSAAFDVAFCFPDYFPSSTTNSPRDSKSVSGCLQNMPVLSCHAKSYSSGIDNHSRLISSFSVSTVKASNTNVLPVNVTDAGILTTFVDKNCDNLLGCTNESLEKEIFIKQEQDIVSKLEILKSREVLQAKKFNHFVNCERLCKSFDCSGFLYTSTVDLRKDSHDHSLHTRCRSNLAAKLSIGPESIASAAFSTPNACINRCRVVESPHSTASKSLLSVIIDLNRMSIKESSVLNGSSNDNATVLIPDVNDSASIANNSSSSSATGASHDKINHKITVSLADKHDSEIFLENIW